MQYRGFELRPGGDGYIAIPLNDDGTLQVSARYIDGKRVEYTKADGTPLYVTMWTGDKPLVDLEAAKRWVDESFPE